MADLIFPWQNLGGDDKLRIGRLFLNFAIFARNREQGTRPPRWLWGRLIDVVRDLLVL